jgi:small multidrug resistance pump
MKYVIALAVALTLNAAANLLMKVGMQSVQQAGGVFRGGLLPAIKTVLTSVPLIVGLTCFALNAAFYMYALQSKKLPISIAYPIMVGGGYALIAVIARDHPVLHESLTLGQIVGVGLVLLGVFVIAYQTKAAA